MGPQTWIHSFTKICRIFFLLLLLAATETLTSHYVIILPLVETSPFWFFILHLLHILLLLYYSKHKFGEVSIKKIKIKAKKLSSLIEMLIGTWQEEFVPEASAFNDYKGLYPSHLCPKLPFKEIKYIWDNLRNTSNSRKNQPSCVFHKAQQFNLYSKKYLWKKNVILITKIKGITKQKDDFSWKKNI